MTDLNQINSTVQSGDAKIAGVAMGAQQLDPAQAQAALDAADQQKRMIALLMARVQSKCDDVVKAKRTIEQRMVDDIRQYDGASRIRMSKNDTTSTTVNSEPPRIHATRSRTDALESRLSDMLFPTNDHPWDMTPTPDADWESPDPQDPSTAGYGVMLPNGPPTAPQAAAPQPQPQPQPPPPQQGDPSQGDPSQGDPSQGDPSQQQQGPPQPQPPSPAEIKQKQSDDIDAACQRMKKTIQDQLSECKFTSVGRRMLRDACRYGFGVVGGPFVTTKIQRRFSNDGGSSMKVREVPIPAIKYCDPWCFFPDMVPNLDKAEFVFYLNLMSPREVQELADHPGFNRDEIIALLKEDPDLGAIKVNLAYRNQNMDSVEMTSGRYGVWRFTGTMERKDVESLSCLFPELQDDLCGMSDAQDLPAIPMVDMWFCQGHPLKARIRPIEKDFRVPYYVFSPFPADDTVFGYGIPYLTRDSQRVVDAAWRIALHNASVSAGPIIITRAGKVQPRDRSWEFKGPKVMEVTDPDMRLDDCLLVHNVENTGQQALAILDRAMQILDDEAMTPQVLQGDATQSVPTSSGLAMLFNAASIVMRRAASCADDDVFQPIMLRMYWWNMLYSDRQDIKGDYDVVPLGQSKMLVKDVQIQHLQAFMQQSMNPALAPYINMPEALKLWTNLLELPTDRVLNDADIVQQQMSQQQDPQQAKLQAETQATIAKGKELESRAHKNVIDAQHKAQGGTGPDPAAAQMHAQDIQVRREEAQAQVTSNAMKLQADLAKLHQSHDGKVQDNVASIHIAHVKAATDLHKEGMKTQVEAAKLAESRNRP